MDSKRTVRVRLPTRLDRYPAKMVSRLADRLIDRYASGVPTLFDPFAGSGAILVAAKKRGIKVSGADINPISGLFVRVKIDGFHIEAGRRLLRRVLRAAERKCVPFAVDLDNKDYWFTRRTLEKFESIRGAIAHLRLTDSPEKAAILLSLSLAVRVCSRADQRSPKPFISKYAIVARRGRHFDPGKVVSEMFEELCTYYGASTAPKSETQFLTADLRIRKALSELPQQARIITSPPYLNAQDYFRNFKLELYMLEGLLPFEVDALKTRFIGTERALRSTVHSAAEIEAISARLPILGRIERKSPRNAEVVRRYFIDMDAALKTTCSKLRPDGMLVIVCGDNRVADERIPTWQVIAAMVEDLGLALCDSFADPIKDRLLAPRRLGHRGLIKEEIVMAFKDPKAP